MYFEVKVKHTETNAEGKAVKKTSFFLIDAESYTETEARTVEVARDLISGDYFIKSITRSKLEEVIYVGMKIGESDIDYNYFKVVTTSIDDESGKRKTFKNYFLVQAKTPEDVSAIIANRCREWIHEWKITSVAEVAVDEIFEYEEKEASE